MASWGKCDFSEFKAMADRFRSAADIHASERFTREVLLELGNMLLAGTKRRTPVDTGKLEANWFITNVRQRGDVFEIEIYNNTEYAPWVENGHRTVKLVIITSDYTVPSSELIELVQTTVDPETNHGEGIGIAPIGHTVTVTGVTAQTVNIQSNITFISGWDWEAAQSQIEDAVEAYFGELAEEWADADATIVRISQIETRLLDLSCVLDIADTTLNGQAKNLQVDADSIPALGTIGAVST